MITIAAIKSCVRSCKQAPAPPRVRMRVVSSISLGAYTGWRDASAGFGNRWPESEGAYEGTPKIAASRRKRVQFARRRKPFDHSLTFLLQKVERQSAKRFGRDLLKSHKPVREGSWLLASGSQELDQELLISCAEIGADAHLPQYCANLARRYFFGDTVASNAVCRPDLCSFGSCVG